MLQLILLLAVVTSSTEGLNCRRCSQGAWNTLSTGNNDCYNSAITTPTIVCVAPQTYCLATFTIKDGQVSGVARGCADPATDYDTTTTTIPTGPDCTTSYSTISSSADTTTCFYPCSASDNCNSLSTLGLRTCTAGSNNCNSATNQGYCNFFTGSCVCNAGFSGNECQTAAAVAVTTRSCVQCNSVTDDTCETMTTSTPCPANVAIYKFCEASWSHTIDSTGAVIRSVITRGCSNVQQTPDRCRFSALMDSRFVGHHEYTCTSTCESNGCNTFNPDGLITGSETKAVYCVVCEDKSGNGLCNSATTRRLCPAGTTHCSMNATYLMANKEDLTFNDENPVYQLESVYRDCATAAVTKGCTSTKVGTLSANRVVCKETCKMDGCNTGWPARPLCAQCSSSNVGSFGQCHQSPPQARQCSHPYFDRCYYHDKNLQSSTSATQPGFTRSMERGCTRFDHGNTCTTTTVGSTTLRSCNVTCSTTGCNQGLPSGGSTLNINLLMLFPTFFGTLFQILCSST